MRYRNIEKVIEAIRSEVPKDFNRYDSFMSDLDDVIDSSHYRAPEAYVVNFEQLGNYLYEAIGEPNTPWKKRIADIFNAKIEVPGMEYIDL